MLTKQLPFVNIRTNDGIDLLNNLFFQDRLFIHESVGDSFIEELESYHRKRDKNQSTDFSFTRFLVPRIMNYKGWALFMDCDMLCRADITKLWAIRDINKSELCVKHDHSPKTKTKFLGEIQTKYPKKNWSSLMLFRCKQFENKLTKEYLDNATPAQLHEFHFLNEENII